MNLNPLYFFIYVLEDSFGKDKIFNSLFLYLGLGKVGLPGAGTIGEPGLSGPGDVTYPDVLSPGVHLK